jgi:hypothetical protein
VFCRECETIARELGEAYADAWASCDRQTKEAWVAVYRMIGGTERDAESAEELTRKIQFPEPLGFVFGSPGRSYIGFPKAQGIVPLLQRRLAHEARARQKIPFPPDH